MAWRPGGTVRGERGVVLSLVIITSIIFGIAAFGLLTMALSRLRISGALLGPNRLRAGYAAEAGVVMAMQELWANPADCAFGPANNGVYTIDTYNDGDPSNDTTVTVTTTGCPPTPGTKLQAKVTF